MGTTLKEMLGSLPAERVVKIQARANELEVEEIEMSLCEIRKSLSFTQGDVAKILEVGQGSISRTEKRKDPLVSTLREYVGALGGKLKLVVDFPDRPSINLAAIEIIDEDEITKKGKYKRDKSMVGCV